MAKEIKTIGVLTSGGDAPGMNAAIRAVVILYLNTALCPVVIAVIVTVVIPVIVPVVVPVVIPVIIP